MQARIIPFPGMRETVEPEETSRSNVYVNLKALFEICETVRSCTFYLDTAETSFREGRITETELVELRRIGREKRQKLAQPEGKKIKADGPGVYYYHPEMGEEPPENAEIHARTMYYAGHIALYTPLTLKGRGIRLEDRPVSGWPDGTKAYTVTRLAYEKLKERYVIAFESLLD